MSEVAVTFDTAAAERRAERIRLRLDSIADGVTAVLPMIREAIEKGDPEALGYRSVGEYVSDRFGSALSRLPVDLRRPVVHELHAAGMSTRAIAPVVDVSQQVVQNDIKVTKSLSPAPAVDPDTGEILDDPTPATVVPKIVDTPAHPSPHQRRATPRRFTMTRNLLHAALSILAGALLAVLFVWALLATLSLDIPVL